MDFPKINWLVALGELVKRWIKIINWLDENVKKSLKKMKVNLYIKLIGFVGNRQVGLKGGEERHLQVSEMEKIKKR